MSRPDRAELIRRHERRLASMAPAEVPMLEKLGLFSGIPEKARPKVLEKVSRFMHVCSFEHDEVVLREGDYSDSAFYIVEGRVDVLLSPSEIELRKADPSRAPGRPLVRGGAHVAGGDGGRTAIEGRIGRGGDGHTVTLAAFPVDVAPGGRKTLDAGEIFGEISALARFPVSATVKANGPVRLLQIRLPGLRMLIRTSKEFKAFLDTRYRERTLARHLRVVPLFEGLDDATIWKLQERADLLSFEPGQVVATQGTPAEGFYLVRGGYLKLSVATGGSDLAVTYLRKGDYAGETALLLDEPWPFTLQALEHVELVKLGRDEFADVLAAQPGLETKLWEQMTARLKLRGYVARNPVSSEYVQMAMDTGLIHGESVLLIDLSTCTRCDECVRGCADSHQGVPRFIREGSRYRNWLMPTACYQCTDPVCMIDCPTGAITRAVGTLEVTVNPETCIGCSNCAKRCPWGNIVMSETGEKRADGKPVELATKCDLCLGRDEGPACVQMCPHGSAVRISFKDMERVTSTLR